MKYTLYIQYIPFANKPNTRKMAQGWLFKLINECKYLHEAASKSD